MFIDPVTLQFYSADIGAIPEGSIEIPYEYYRTLIDGRDSGKIIKIVDNWPVLADAPVPELTPAQILAMQSAKLLGLKQLAEAQKAALSSRISTLQDAIDNIGVEGMEEFAATEEEQIEFPKRKAQLTKWKNYAILLGRVTSQGGWPPEVDWPVQPLEGMDLTTSSVEAL